MRRRKLRPMTTTTQEHSSSRKLIDFPCSYAWRAYYTETIDGIILPSIELPEPEETKPKEVVHIHRHSDMSKQEYDLLQQMALKVDHLQKKITELQASRKPRGKYQQLDNS